VIGAIGSSGGTVDQDQSVVDAALAAFEEERSHHADYATT